LVNSVRSLHKLKNADPNSSDQPEGLENSENQPETSKVVDHAKQTP
jgi:hypothetical protein